MNNIRNYKRKVHILKKVILCKFKLDIQILYKIQLGIVHLTPEGCRNNYLFPFLSNSCENENQKTNHKQSVTSYFVQAFLNYE